MHLYFTTNTEYRGGDYVTTTTIAPLLPKRIRQEIAAFEKKDLIDEVSIFSETVSGTEMSSTAATLIETLNACQWEECVENFREEMRTLHAPFSIF